MGAIRHVPTSLRRNGQTNMASSTRLIIRSHFCVTSERVAEVTSESVAEVAHFFPTGVTSAIRMRYRRSNFWKCRFSHLWKSLKSDYICL